MREWPSRVREAHGWAKDVSEWPNKVRGRMNGQKVFKKSATNG
ncbi:hypothetical protein [Bartonella bovis]|nr:hypothetical protein [Bartonella bovis]